MSCLHPQVLTEAAHGSSLAGLQRLLRSYTRYAPRLVEDAFRTYYNVLSALPGRWERLLPPYDRVAVLLGGTDILTFDGTLLHIPKTRCKVVLLEVQHVKIVMSHPNPQFGPEVIVKLLNTTVTIKPNLEIESYPLLAKSNAVQVLHLEARVEIRLPSLRLVMPRKGGVVAVEVSGWTYGATRGMLGTYDGEVATDTLTPGGQQVRTEDLPGAWREDMSCTLAPASRPIPSFGRVVACYALLGPLAR